MTDFAVGSGPKVGLEVWRRPRHLVWAPVILIVRSRRRRGLGEHEVPGEYEIRHYETLSPNWFVGANLVFARLCGRPDRNGRPLEWRLEEGKM